MICSGDLLWYYNSLKYNKVVSEVQYNHEELEGSVTRQTSIQVFESLLEILGNFGFQIRFYGN